MKWAYDYIIYHDAFTSLNYNQDICPTHLIIYLGKLPVRIEMKELQQY